MGDAKNIIVKPISAADANKVIRAVHYSRKVVMNSQLHLGVFLNDRLGGAMQFGPSLDKRKMLGLVKGTLWNEFLELNRLAFSDWLPRNSESRAISFAMRWIKKTYPWMKWVVSFADGTQCGDGTIYRASGFVLTGIKKNTTIWELGDEVFTDISYRIGAGVNRRINKVAAAKGKNILKTGAASMKHLKEAGAHPLPGFQLRYIYFLDPKARENLAVPVVPFSEIEKCGARMYKGKPISAESIGSDAPSLPAGGGRRTSDLGAQDVAEVKGS